MSEAIERVVTMLSMIPRAPRKTTVKELMEQLTERGFTIKHRRTVERDLVSLSKSRHFPLLCDGHKPAGWSWVQGAQMLDIPCMDAHTALTFRLAARFLEPMLPRSTLRFLDPHFEKAGQILQSRGGQKLSDWPSKIHVLPKGQQLLQPEITQEIIEVIYSALLEEKRFLARYRKRGAKTAKEYKVDPLGLVYRNDQVYLICCVQGRDNPIQLVLHRLKSAKLLDEVRQAPDDFDLASYVQEGGFNYADNTDSETNIKLQVLFERNAAIYLYETPLSRDQTIEEADDNHIVVKATVKNDWQLRWWLLGFGDKAQVQKPKALREQFAQQVKRMAEAYGG